MFCKDCVKAVTIQMAITHSYYSFVLNKIPSILHSNKEKRDRFSVALYATEEQSPGNEKLYARQNRGGKKKINKEANWMVSNSAKLDSRTKQHTQSGVSTSDGSRDIAATKSCRKKKK